MRQNAVEDHAPNIAQHHAADQVGHEEHGAEQVGAAHLLGQGIGDEEGQHIDQDDGDHGEKGRRVLEGVAGSRRPSRLWYSSSGPTHSASLRNIEVAEGQVDALQERPDEADAEGSEHGGRMNSRRPPLDGTADQSAVQPGAVIFFCSMRFPRFPVLYFYYIWLLAKDNRVRTELRSGAAAQDRRLHPPKSRTYRSHPVQAGTFKGAG